MRNNTEEIKIAPLTIMAFGCDQYDFLRNLNGVKSDIERINDIFCGNNEYSIFDEANFIEIYNTSAEELRKEINKYIVSRSADGDVLLLYFAGHGTAIGRDNFGFCMQDAFYHREEGIILPTSVVTISEIISSLHIKSIYPIFLIDSCYSGAIAKKLDASFSEISVELNRNLAGAFASDFGLLTITDDITPAKDYEDGGILTKTLEDVCKQGLGEIYSQKEYLTISELLKLLIKNISENGNKRLRAYIPSGQIADYAIMKNVQYSPPEIPENRYSFTSIYKKILDALWNNGNEAELEPSEILEKTGSQSAYGNHNKLSFAPWDLVEDKPDSRKRRLTEKGRKFIQGQIEIPKGVVVNKETQKCLPQKNTPMISYSDL